MRRVLATLVAGCALAATPAFFEDMAPHRGISFVLRNSATPEKHQIETMTGGVALFDYDNDGKLDVFFANGAEQPSLQKTSSSYFNRLYRNLGGWKFEDVTANAGLNGQGFSVAAAAADFDNDGHTDLFVAGVHASHLYRNRGDGTFEDVTAKAGVANRGRWAVSAGWFDYDNDGRLDLFVVNYVKWDPATEPFCGNQPASRSYCHPRNYEGLANTLYRNNGDGSFTDVSAQSGIAGYVGKGMGVAFADYDGDGFMDVFVANDTVPNYLFHNERDGTFREVGFVAGVAMNDDGRALSSMGVDFRDLRNTGRPDLFITALINESFPLFINTGKGLFNDATNPSQIGPATRPLSGWGAGAYDFDNDGRKDLFAACGDVQNGNELPSGRSARQTNLLLLAARDGSFTAHEIGTPAWHRGAAFGDLDGDGRVDAVVTRLGGMPELWRNTLPGDNHWLDLVLTGNRSNRDAIGASVHLYSDSGEQWNHVTTSVGFAGSSERAVHFGLGREKLVRLLQITWPSGAVQHLRDVKADQRLAIQESAGAN